jgi:hypothetical protein
MELALEQSDVVVKAIVEAVATAGELKVPRILDDRIQDETGRKMSRPAYPYQEHVFATIGGKFVYCAWNPKNLVAPAMIMQLHLSHFSDVSEFLGWSSDTFGDLTDEILRARIRRGDFCVDLGLPFEALEQALYQPRATKVVKWTSRRRTLYIGAKPRQSYIYEKSVPVSSLDYVDQKFIGDGRNGVVKATRLEVRHHGAYLKVPNLSFGGLTHLNIFICFISTKRSSRISDLKSILCSEPSYMPEIDGVLTMPGGFSIVRETFLEALANISAPLTILFFVMPGIPDVADF